MLKQKHIFEASTFAFLNGTEVLLLGGDSGTIHSIEIDTAFISRRFPLSNDQKHDGIICLASHLIAYNSARVAFSLYSLDVGVPMSSLRFQPIPQPSAPISDICTSRDVNDLLFFSCGGGIYAAAVNNDGIISFSGNLKVDTAVGGGGGPIKGLGTHPLLPLLFIHGASGAVQIYDFGNIRKGFKANLGIRDSLTEDDERSRRGDDDGDGTISTSKSGFLSAGGSKDRAIRSFGQWGTSSFTRSGKTSQTTTGALAAHNLQQQQPQKEQFSLRGSLIPPPSVHTGTAASCTSLAISTDGRIAAAIWNHHHLCVYDIGCMLSAGGMSPSGALSISPYAFSSSIDESVELKSVCFHVSEPILFTQNVKRPGFSGGHHNNTKHSSMDAFSDLFGDSDTNLTTGVTQSIFAMEYSSRHFVSAHSLLDSGLSCIGTHFVDITAFETDSSYGPLNPRRIQSVEHSGTLLLQYTTSRQKHSLQNSDVVAVRHSGISVECVSLELSPMWCAQWILGGTLRGVSLSTKMLPPGDAFIEGDQAIRHCASHTGGVKDDIMASHQVLSLGVLTVHVTLTLSDPQSDHVSAGNAKSEINTTTTAQQYFYDLYRTPLGLSSTNKIPTSFVGIIPYRIDDTVSVIASAVGKNVNGIFIPSRISSSDEMNDVLCVPVNSRGLHISPTGNIVDAIVKGSLRSQPASVNALGIASSSPPSRFVGITINDEHNTTSSLACFVRCGSASISIATSPAASDDKTTPAVDGDGGWMGFETAFADYRDAVFWRKKSNFSSQLLENHDAGLLCLSQDGMELFFISNSAQSDCAGVISTSSLVSQLRDSVKDSWALPKSMSSLWTYDQGYSSAPILFVTAIKSDLYETEVGPSSPSALNRLSTFSADLVHTNPTCINDAEESMQESDKTGYQRLILTPRGQPVPPVSNSAERIPSEFVLNKGEIVIDVCFQPLPSAFQRASSTAKESVSSNDADDDVKRVLLGKRREQRNAWMVASFPDEVSSLSTKFFDPIIAVLTSHRILLLSSSPNTSLRLMNEVDCEDPVTSISWAGAVVIYCDCRGRVSYLLPKSTLLCQDYPLMPAESHTTPEEAPGDLHNEWKLNLYKWLASLGVGPHESRTYFASGLLFSLSRSLVASRALHILACLPDRIVFNTSNARLVFRVGTEEQGLTNYPGSLFPVSRPFLPAEPLLLSLLLQVAPSIGKTNNSYNTPQLLWWTDWLRTLVKLVSLYFPGTQISGAVGAEQGALPATHATEKLCVALAAVLPHLPIPVATAGTIRTPQIALRGTVTAILEAISGSSHSVSDSRTSVFPRMRWVSPALRLELVVRSAALLLHSSGLTVTTAAATDAATLMTLPPIMMASTKTNNTKTQQPIEASFDVLRHCSDLLSDRPDLQDILLDPELYGGQLLPHRHSALAHTLSSASSLLLSLGYRNEARLLADIAGDDLALAVILTNDARRLHRAAAAATAATVNTTGAKSDTLLAKLTARLADISSLREAVRQVNPSVYEALTRFIDDDEISLCDTDIKLTRLHRLARVASTPREKGTSLLNKPPIIRRMHPRNVAGGFRRMCLLVLSEELSNDNIVMSPATFEKSTSVQSQPQTQTITDPEVLASLLSCTRTLLQLEETQRENILARGGGLGPISRLGVTPSLAMDRIEDWVIGRVYLETLNAERSEVGGGTGGGGGIGSFAMLKRREQERAELLAKQREKAKSAQHGAVDADQSIVLPVSWIDDVGQGREWDKLVGYWRFSDLRVSGASGFVSSGLPGARCVFTNLSKYGAPVLEFFAASNEAAKSVSLEPTTSPVDPGEDHERVKALYDVLYGDAVNNDVGSSAETKISEVKFTRGFRAVVGRGGPLDLALCPLDSDRDKMTIELWVRFDSSLFNAVRGAGMDEDPAGAETDSSFVLLTRVAGPPPGSVLSPSVGVETTLGNCVAQYATGRSQREMESLWRLSVTRDGALEWAFGSALSSTAGGNEEISSSLPRSVRTSPGLVNGASFPSSEEMSSSSSPGWVHIAAVVDASDVMSGSHKSSVILFVNGNRVAKSSLLSPTAVSDDAIKSTLTVSTLYAGLNLPGGSAITELRIWADCRSEVDVDTQRMNNLPLASKRRRLQFRIKGGKKLFSSLDETALASIGNYESASSSELTPLDAIFASMRSQDDGGAVDTTAAGSGTDHLGAKISSTITNKLDSATDTFTTTAGSRGAASVPLKSAPGFLKPPVVSTLAGSLKAPPAAHTASAVKSKASGTMSLSAPPQPVSSASKLLQAKSKAITKPVVASSEVRSEREGWNVDPFESSVDLFSAPSISPVKIERDFLWADSQNPNTTASDATTATVRNDVGGDESLVTGLASVDPVPMNTEENKASHITGDPTPPPGVITKDYYNPKEAAVTDDTGSHVVDLPGESTTASFSTAEPPTSSEEMVPKPALDFTAIYPETTSVAEVAEMTLTEAIIEVTRSTPASPGGLPATTTMASPFNAGAEEKQEYETGSESAPAMTIPKLSDPSDHVLEASSSTRDISAVTNDGTPTPEAGAERSVEDQTPITDLSDAALASTSAGAAVTAGHVVKPSGLMMKKPEDEKLSIQSELSSTPPSQQQPQQYVRYVRTPRGSTVEKGQGQAQQQGAVMETYRVTLTDTPTQHPAATTVLISQTNAATAIPTSTHPMIPSDLAFAADAGHNTLDVGSSSSPVSEDFSTSTARSINDIVAVLGRGQEQEGEDNAVPPFNEVKTEGEGGHGFSFIALHEEDSEVSQAQSLAVGAVYDNTNYDENFTTAATAPTASSSPSRADTGTTSLSNDAPKESSPSTLENVLERIRSEDVVVSMVSVAPLTNLSGEKGMSIIHRSGGQCKPLAQHLAVVLNTVGEDLAAAAGVSEGHEVLVLPLSSVLPSVAHIAVPFPVDCAIVSSLATATAATSNVSDAANNRRRPLLALFSHGHIFIYAFPRWQMTLEGKPMRRVVDRDFSSALVFWTFAGIDSLILVTPTSVQLWKVPEASSSVEEMTSSSIPPSTSSSFKPLKICDRIDLQFVKSWSEMRIVDVVISDGWVMLTSHPVRRDSHDTVSGNGTNHAVCLVTLHHLKTGRNRAFKALAGCFRAGNQVCLVYDYDTSATDEVECEVEGQGRERENRFEGRNSASSLSAALIDLDRVPWNNSRTKDAGAKFVTVAGSTGAISVTDLKQSRVYSSCVRWTTDFEVMADEAKPQQREEVGREEVPEAFNSDGQALTDMSIGAHVCSAGEYLFVLSAGAEVNLLDGATGDVLLYLTRSQTPTSDPPASFASLISATTDFSDVKAPAILGIFANGAVERLDLGPLARRVKNRVSGKAGQKRWVI